ncbi:TKL family protein kinase [Trichomonas vaginalis G3]|uniref:TKL family protein kinase n=1 Tax=Trichomonas vaginalis (strain ATCC PRA-98 / G3) TaxID=412133 RepID=A2DRD6_TRIV3|nr:protein kinase protein [Trichomonas vaginalis G3]EAY17062.1 TKL family protein kinase [Trichomonas vaginalis G3]KAI5517934.1 protein kinase protein [Trichomonas vaginalis G3]|eukprot:XP_001329285.1 TKL family protein kinase [Trichomonas vaginalis G3]
MQNDSFPPEAHHYILYYDNLQFVKVIGNGAYGEVWEGIYLPTQKKVAIKKLHTDILDGNMHELYNREVLALSTLKNTFLLPFIGFTTVPPYCIVTKFIPNNSLFNNLHGKENALQLTPTEFNIIAFGIAVGMSYLHANKTIHRDLKSQNVLIDDRKYPIICDFGSSKNTDLSLTMTGQGGTPSYMAPEFLQNEKYDEKVDVYSY